MAKKIIWSPQSEEDFENILNYLASKWDANVAVKFIDLVDALLMQIASNPRQFPIIHKKFNIRKCVITKQNTLYYRNRSNANPFLPEFDRYFFYRQKWRREVAIVCKQITKFSVTETKTYSRVSPHRECLKSA